MGRIGLIHNQVCHTYTTSVVLYVYYIYYILYLCVAYTPVLHMHFYTCVEYTHVLHVWNMCITGVLHTYTGVWFTCVIHPKHHTYMWSRSRIYTCITSVKPIKSVLILVQSLYIILSSYTIIIDMADVIGCHCGNHM